LSLGAPALALKRAGPRCGGAKIAD